jgi:hypothetical protein
MKTELAIIAASVLGTIAFNEGRTSIPIHDPHLYKILSELEDKEMSAGTAVMRAWATSWHAANRKPN